MTIRDMVNRLTLATAALALILVGPVTAGEGGGATVEEVIEYCKGKTSLADLLPMVHPDDQPTFAYDMEFAGIAAPIFAIDDSAAPEVQEAAYAEYEAEFEAVLEKHVVKEPPEDAPPADTAENYAIRAGYRYEGVDIAALVKDLEEWMLGILPEEVSSRMVPDFALVEGLEIDGDSASATVDGRPVGFRRVDGRWYLMLEVGS